MCLQKLKRRKMSWFGLDMTYWQTLFYKVVLKVQGKGVALKGIGWTTSMKIYT